MRNLLKLNVCLYSNRYDNIARHYPVYLMEVQCYPNGSAVLSICVF